MDCLLFEGLFLLCLGVQEWKNTHYEFVHLICTLYLSLILKVMGLIGMVQFLSTLSTNKSLWTIHQYCFLQLRRQHWINNCTLV